MRKIGTTSSGTILVEMNKEQFEALSKISSPLPAHPQQASEQSSEMSFADKVEFVRPRIVKLAPKKPDALIRSVKTMFNFTGGITDSEAEKIVNQLKKSGVIQITENSKVSYKLG